MPLALQLLLLALLAAVAGALILLVAEVRRGVRAAEAFLAASRRDLEAIAGDVRAARQRLETTLDTLGPGLASLAGCVTAAEEAAAAWRGLMDRYRQGLAKGAGLLGLALGAFRTFNPPPSEAPSRR
ncbi:MAG TPA: hypothetical protein VFT46_00835 [Holophagaceae bacterium]|nr:hypothetical protein [Holophagaceae bacterium]